MKKLYLIVVAAFMLAFANQTMAQSNAVKLNIFSLAIGTYNVSYERAIDDMHTAQLGFFYLGYKIGSGDYKTSFTGFGITPEFRIYFDEALSGWYVAPFLRYQNYTIKEDFDIYDDPATPAIESGIGTARGTLQTFGVGVIAGHQWLLGEHFTIDVFLGPVYNAGSAKVSSDSDADNYEFSTGAFDGFGIRTGLTFGFAF
jgi:hypothetical protein